MSRLGRVVGSVSFGTGPGNAVNWLAVGDDAVWASLGFRIVRIGETPIPGAGAVAVGEGAIWVASGTTLLKLKPA
ncbi:MAG: hypothetical protein H0W87_06900 [Actinobacteria bacterium]|nr:hypothetical protein [Actinomycetota bacterium]